MKKGIDISTHQKLVDWPAVKAAGVEFAMLRAGFAQTLDNMFLSHVHGAQEAGIPVGVYWFSYALNADEARAEAQKCLETIKPYKVTYPVAYDFEYASVTNMAKAGITATRELVTEIVKAFCAEIEAAGYTPIVYANPDYLSKYIDIGAIGRELWMAAYTGKTPEAQDQSEKCRMWQWTDKGSVDGIAGHVDLNVWYDDKAAAADNTYTVVKGDTPWGIAVKLLGNGLRYPEIMTLNGLAKNAHIYAGQVLRIPTSAAATPEYRTHKVVKGDTLWGLASRYLGSGFKFTEIMKLNGMKLPWIYAGRLLKIPNK